MPESELVDDDECADDVPMLLKKIRAFVGIVVVVDDGVGAAAMDVEEVVGSIRLFVELNE